MIGPLCQPTNEGSYSRPKFPEGAMHLGPCKGGLLSVPLRGTCEWAVGTPRYMLVAPETEKIPVGLGVFQNTRVDDSHPISPKLIDSQRNIAVDNFLPRPASLPSTANHLLRVPSNLLRIEIRIAWPNVLHMCTIVRYGIKEEETTLG